MKISKINFLVFAAAVASLGFANAAHADQWNKAYTISGHAQLRLTTNDGAIELNPSNGKQISARVETLGYRIDSSDVSITEHQTGDAVEIEVHVPQHNFHFFDFGNDHRSVHVYVDVPRESDLDIHSGDGSITARDIAGKVHLDSGDGHLRVSNLHGDLQFHTRDGRIEGSGLDGALSADTGDGSILLSGRFDRVDAHTRDGHIELGIENGSKMNGPWTVRTNDGRIHVRLPDGFSAQLDANTRDGRITSEFPITVSGSLDPRSLRAKLGGGGESLTIRSGDGSIFIEKI
jgi:Putative adhesin